MTKLHFEKTIAGKKLIMFGAGRVANTMLSTILRGYEISYICDNDSTKWGGGRLKWCPNMRPFSVVR